MRFNGKQLLAVFAVFLVLGSGVAAAAAYGLNPSADQHPTTYYQEDKLTVESHNASTMGWLEYEGDNGTIQQLKAHVNGTDSGAKVGYRADRIDAAALGEFPRKDSEDGNNSVTWLNKSAWTTTSGVSVSDTDGVTGSGVDSVTVATDGTQGSGNTTTASYGSIGITNDAEKRYLQFVGNINQLETGAVVAMQVHDTDGDYVEAEINASRDSTADDVIANSTAKGVIYQRQLGQFSVQGTGDGALGAVETVKLVTTDGDSEVVVTGLNVQKKSRWDFGSEQVPDLSTDDTDDYKSQTVYNRPGGDVINATSLQGLGDAFSDATLNKLVYYDVHYRMQDSPASVSLEWDTDAASNYPSFDVVLDVSFRRSIQTAYDLSHGDIDLKHEQSFLSERYIQLRYAEAVGSTDTEDIADSSWVDVTGSLGEQDKTIVIDDTVQPDAENVVEFEVKLLSSQQDALEPAVGSSGGFWEQGGGGNPFMSLWNWFAGGVVGLLTVLGLKSRGG